MATPYLSEAASKLEPQHHALVEERRRITEQLDEQIQGLEAAIDSANLAMRPVYPTAEQVAGIEKAAELVHSGETRPSPLEPSLATDGSVRFNSVAPRISIYTRAPHQRLGMGRPLWHFTKEDRAAFDRLLETHDLAITDRYNHAEGFTVFVKSTRVPEGATSDETH